MTVNLEALAEAISNELRASVNELRLAGLAAQSSINVAADGRLTVDFEIHDTHHGTYGFSLALQDANDTSSLEGLIRDQQGKIVQDLGQASFANVADGLAAAREMITAAITEVSDRFRRRAG